jgi:hypothetical protein
MSGLSKYCGKYQRYVIEDDLFYQYLHVLSLSQCVAQSASWSIDTLEKKLYASEEYG